MQSHLNALVLGQRSAQRFRQFQHGPDLPITHRSCSVITAHDGIEAKLLYSEDASQILSMHLPATPPLTVMVAYPALKYLISIRRWRSGTLNGSEELALLNGQGTERAERDFTQALCPKGDTIISVLPAVGRAHIESIARSVRMSESSVSRRMDWMQRIKEISIRALVEPASDRWPVEAPLWAIHLA